MSAALGLIGLTPEEEATLVQLRETEGLKGIYMHEHARSPAEPPKSDEPASAAPEAMVPIPYTAPPRNAGKSSG